MSRGGANPNWEYQLVSPDGHYSDEGLRQRRMVLRGHQPPGRREASKVRKRQEKALDLKALFKNMPKKEA